MDHLECIRIFQTVADLSSFAEAARRLRIAPVAASRAVAELERQLGVALLRRTTRSVRLTEEGADYLARSRRALELLDDAARAVRGEDAPPRGLLVVTAPVMFGRLHIVPIVADLLRDHPGLSVKLSLLDRVVRLAEEGVDVAVRIAHLPDSALHATRLAAVSHVLVASPDYLARRGTPDTQEALAGHDLIAFDSATLNHESRRSGAEARLAPRLLTNSVDATIDAAVRGLGVARLFSYHVARELAEGKLIRLLPEASGEAVPVSMVYQTGRQQSTNLRAFLDAAKRALPGYPAL